MKLGKSESEKIEQWTVRAIPFPFWDSSSLGQSEALPPQRGHTASAPSVTARPGRLAQEPRPATGESEHVMWRQRKEMDTRSGMEPVLWASSTR